MMKGLKVPRPESWRGEGVAEGAIMRAVFHALVAASAVMLALDLGDMMQRAPGGADSERTEPIVMEPPSRTDQERPYFPKAMPLAPGSKPPDMPGLTTRVTPQMAAARMSFNIGDGGDVSAVGRIEPGTAAEFDEFVKASSGKAKRVWLHSPGGSVADAIAMGRAIRKAGLGTIVTENAYCASSCPLAFVGGAERGAGRKAWIGVHQVYTLPAEAGTLHQGLADAQRVSAECQEHLVAMGADPRIWIKAMKTAKERLYVFTPEELIEYKLVTQPAAPRPAPKAPSP